MSGRQFRKLLLFAVALALGWWIYKYRPTVSGIVDTVTRPIFGTKAAVKGDERNRVVEESVESLSTQGEARIETLKEGMLKGEVRDLLGKPDTVTPFQEQEKPFERWTYLRLRRELVFNAENRLVSLRVVAAR
jgi:hypothetical protein